MDEISRFVNYREYKQKLDAELQKTAEGFVKIGFLLKQARDTNILKESKYDNYIEFAKTEYGIDKTTVSRFIRINDTFSEGGNSETLQEAYQGYGYAKLAIMLQLPEEVNRVLTPEYTKSEIQTIKDEVDEESKISDLEVISEAPQTETSMIYKALEKMMHDEPDLYEEMYKIMRGTGNTEERKRQASDILAPSGIKADMVRIPGIGRLLVSFKGADKNIEIVNVRSGEKKVYEWDQMLEEIEAMIPEAENMKMSWERLYKEPFLVKEELKKPEVAPVQLKKTSKVTKAKKEEPPVASVLHDVNPEIPRPDPIEKEFETQQKGIHEEEPLTDEQIIGQDTIKNHPEWMANDLNQTIDTEIVETAGDSNYKKKINTVIWNEIDKVKREFDLGYWDMAIASTEELLFKLKKFKEIEEMKENEAD